MKLSFIIERKNHPNVKLLVTIISLLTLLPRLQADSPPVIPVGLDAYTKWDHWCDQRIGQRTYMPSTADPKAANGDTGNCRFEINDPNVTTSEVGATMDIQGPGVVVFQRYNNQHGSPWHYIIDNVDNVVGDVGTGGLTNPTGSTGFIPQGMFPAGNPALPVTTTGTNPNMPFNFLEAVTPVSDLIWTPLQFTNSFREGYQNPGFATGYYIYNKYTTGAQLSIGGQIYTNNIPAASTWTSSTPPSSQMQTVTQLINPVTTNLTTVVNALSGVSTQTGSMSLAANTNAVDVTTLSGPSVIRSLNFSVPTTVATNFSTVHLRITWDNRSLPSIDAPISLFYGAGTLFTADPNNVGQSLAPTDGQYLVRAFPMKIQFVGTGASQRAQLTCYYPMPFFQSAHIQLVGNGTAFSDVQWSVSTVPFTDRASHVGYFHATYADIPAGAPGQISNVDMTLIDTNTAEGGTTQNPMNWTGSIVGTSIIFSTTGQLYVLEGNPTFFLDDSVSPQGEGTGTEEWGGGGNYWNNGVIATLPFAGHPVGTSGATTGQAAIESFYRFLLPDMLPFGKHAIFKLEHGPKDDAYDHYMTVVFWYGLPGASLTETDSLQLGNSTSESAHSYAAAGSTSYTTPSTQFDGTVTPPAATTDTGRLIPSGSTSTFTLAINPANVGIMLRRKLDYAYPNQTATVSIAPVPVGGGLPTSWQTAGTWYTAGASQYVNVANSATVQYINRNFRETEFLIPKALTSGLSNIYVKITNTTPNMPLIAAMPSLGISATAYTVPTGWPTTVPQAWSELRYDAYSMVMPSFSIGSQIVVTGTAPATATVGTAYNFTYSATGNPAPAFSLASGSLPSGITLSSTGVLFGTPTTAATYTGTINVSNGVNPDANPVNFSITVSALNSYSNWANTYFSGQPQNISGPNATPENDGIPNLQKYLFDIVPLHPMAAADRAALPVPGKITISSTPYLTLTYRQNPTAGGITIHAQTSSDLQTWQAVSNSNIIQIGTDQTTGDPMMQVQVPMSGNRLFIRLNVSEP